MNMHYRHRNRSGFTLPEVMISTGILALTSVGIFQALNSGLVLFAKNTAVTVSHQEGRRSVNRLTRDIHSAVSIPNLIDANMNPVVNQPRDASGKPTGAAGVSFQMVWAGPHFVKQDPGNAYMIMIQDFGRDPAPGMRLIAPHFDIESDITRLSGAASPNHNNVWMADAAEDRIRARLKDGYYAITYYTERVAYVVKNGELQFYKQRFLNGNSTPVWVYQSTVGRSITSATPFYVPLTPSGSPDNRYVGVRLSAADPKSTNRGYASTSTLLDTAIPYRSRLTTYQ